MQAIRLDVTLLDKSRFYKSTKPAKDGHFPIYADIILFNNRDGTDQYGNEGYASQSVTKEERAQGVKLPILGNWKHIGQRPAPQQNQPRHEAPSPQIQSPLRGMNHEDQDIPF